MSLLSLRVRLGPGGCLWPGTALPKGRGNRAAQPHPGFVDEFVPLTVSQTLIAVAIVIGAAPARTSRQGACDDPIDRFSNFTILLLAVRKSDTLTVEIQRDYRPQAETELLHRGFYIAFITPDGPRMSPTKQWDAWYAYLTEKHGLSQKPAFVGMSKGGVNEYTWAAANPDKVSSIYADNPGIYTEDIPKIAELIKYDVPLLNVCGTHDFVLEKNTKVIENLYHQGGGRISIMIKEGTGHHPHRRAHGQARVGLRPRTHHSRVARWGARLKAAVFTRLSISALLALGRVRVPSAAGLRLDVGEASAGRRTGNANQVIAARTLNLPARVAGIAFQRLVAVGTVELEFGRAHSLHPHHA